MTLARLLDALAVLSIDTRTDHEEPIDPIVPVARWLWFELTDRQAQRAAMRGALERAPAESPRLDFGEVAA